MTIEVLHERGVSNRAIARQLGVHEHTVRYRLMRQASGRPDGRASKVFAATPWAAAVPALISTITMVAMMFTMKLPTQTAAAPRPAPAAH